MSVGKTERVNEGQKMDKKANEIQKQLEVTMAFVKAADEARDEQSEREKRIRVDHSQ